MKSLYQKLPSTPGVYLMKNAKGEILYIGKAANLKRRVLSYFQKSHEFRIEKLVSRVKKISFQKTDTALEALILESQLIKKHQPPFNIREKDDKSFLYVEITREKFPRVLLVRGADKKKGEHFGPFIFAQNIREAMKIIRRVFPYNTHPPDKIGKFNRPCFEHEIRLCPGACVNKISQKDYKNNIQNIKLLFKGGKRRILQNLKKEMKLAAKKLNFEKAEELRRQVFALEHIRDISLISGSEPKIKEANPRIEGYDVSNISGASAVGSMVVFRGNNPEKKEYRKFKIRSITGADDIGMLKEVLERRFKNNWPLPELVLVDGGRGQVNAAKKVIGKFGYKIPVIGIAKGPKRKKNEFFGDFSILHLPDDRRTNVITKKTLIRIRDEAHRFAVSYHQKLRAAKSLRN